MADEILEQRTTTPTCGSPTGDEAPRDLIPHNPTPIYSEELLWTFPDEQGLQMKPSANLRLDAAERYLAGHKDVGWRVRLEDAGTLGTDFLLQLGHIISIDDKGNATVDFEATRSGRSRCAPAGSPPTWLPSGPETNFSEAVDSGLSPFVDG